MEGSSLAIKTVPNDIKARGQGICCGGPEQKSPAHHVGATGLSSRPFDLGEGVPQDEAEHQILPSRPLSILVCSIAALVDMEGHLWLNLLGLKDKEQTFLLDAPVLPSGLFGTAVEIVVQ